MQNVDHTGTKTLIKWIIFHGVSPCTTSPPLQSLTVLTTNQPEGHSLTLTCKQQPRINCNRKAHTTHTRDTSKAPGSGDKGDVATGPTGHLLYQTILLRLGDITVLPNTQEQTKGSRQSEETKKHIPHEKKKDRTKLQKNNKMKTSNRPNPEFKTLLIRMLNYLSESFKKDRKHKNQDRKHKKEPFRNEEYNN